MKIELVPHYEQPFKAHPYTHRAEAHIPSLGVLYKEYRIPALYLMMSYHFNEKTGLLCRDAKLTFRPDGPCAAELNFPHAEVVPKYFGEQGMATFEVHMHAIFNKEIVVRKTYKGEGSIGVDKVIKGSVGGSYEKSTEGPEIPVHIHCEYNVTLYAKRGILKVGGAIK